MITYNGNALKVGTSWLGVGSPVPETVTIGGKEYPVVEMPDGKKWLAYNLDFAYPGLYVPTSGASENNNPQAMYYNYDEATYGWGGYKCGLLYNWYAVSYMEAHKSTLFPGWHVPSDAEWNALLNAMGGRYVAGTKLKASNVSWAPSWGGTDDYGFAVLPAGYFYGSFTYISSRAFFWTATQYNSNLAYYCHFGTGAAVGLDFLYKYLQRSVRLVKDADNEGIEGN